MENKFKSLTFFFPYKYPSGVSFLFARMAEYLSEKYGMETCIIDYPDGFASNRLEENTTVRLRLFKDNVPIDIASDTILIMQSVLPYTMRPELQIEPDTKIVFWSLHPFNLVPTIVPLPWFRHLQAKYDNVNRFIMNTLLFPLRKKLQNLIETLVDKKSIFFVDGVNLKSTSERLNIKITNPIYMPIPCDLTESNKKIVTASRNKDVLDFCWLGRLIDFKIHILIYTIKRLSEYAVRKKKKINMHIIGDGPGLKNIEGLNIENDSFQIIYTGVLTGQSLDEYLLNNIDVLAAMGTSALEGAKLGVPTILLDISYGTIKGDYKFKWLFESKDYNVGEIINKNHFGNNNTLDKAIDAIIFDYNLISKKTYEYYTTNHSISSVADKFVDALNDATFTFKDFKPKIFKKSMFRKIYEFFRGVEAKNV